MQPEATPDMVEVLSLGLRHKILLREGWKDREVTAAAVMGNEVTASFNAVLSLVQDC